MLATEFVKKDRIQDTMKSLEKLQAGLMSDVNGLTDMVDARTAATVERATQLANQMLALAKVEQLRQQDDAGVVDLAEAVRSIALELAPLVAAKDLDFELQTRPAPVQAHEWMLRELARNLLHNAIRHSPTGGALTVQVQDDGGAATLVVRDSGPGIPAELAARLYQPFSAGAAGGSGLGLAICHEIVHALGGAIDLENRQRVGHIEGLVATVRLPRATSQTN
mgnify:CR=1 FL=1